MNKKVFIPRDAGFFSVFNFLIGCLHNGDMVYPYFNKKTFLKIRRQNDHFKYWTDSENCWFDFFDPIKFNENDNTHYEGNFGSYMFTGGEEAPKEFRIPEETKKLINDKERFESWRKEINSTYNKFIKINSNIDFQVNDFINCNSLNNSIGVHYRHPSHFIESGKVYLKQYFDEINKIIETNNNIKIFIASDNDFGISAFKKEYGSLVSYYENINRISMDQFLEWAFSLGSGKPDIVGFINGKGYELHHLQDSSLNNYKNTCDLLKETITLSKCQYLIHSLSNISTAISYINPKINMINIKGVN